MQSIRSTRTVLATGLLLALTASAALDAVDVRVAHEKTFDFGAVRTWGWNPAGAGEVKMARTKDDDPEAMKLRVEPMIRDAVSTEMVRRKLTEVTSQPDLTVTYYLLLTVNVETQQIGQFVPTAVVWDLPLFPPATQSIKVLNRGSLVLDLSAGGTVVWRGVADAQLAPDASAEKRESKLREAVRDLMKRYPPK